jgi:hypothetical protein
MGGIMFSRGQLVAGIGAIVCLLGYFLRWGLLGPVNFSMNGWQITFGTTFNGVKAGGHILIVLVLLAPIWVGYVIYRSSIKGGALNKRRDAFGLLLVGAGLVVLLLFASRGIANVGMSLGFGWILCLLSALAIGAGGFFNYRQINQPV